jgi:hypothetical protein
MLLEIQRARQIPGEPRRRWFMSSSMDLIVWFDDQSSPIGFQLCYDKDTPDEKALTWRDERSVHSEVSSGEGRNFSHKGSPLLFLNGKPDTTYIAAQFERQATQIPNDLALWVAQIVREKVGLQAQT